MAQGDKGKVEESKKLMYLRNYFLVFKEVFPLCVLWLYCTNASCNCKGELCNETVMVTYMYRGADKSLARPGRKQATASEDFDVRISYL